MKLINVIVLLFATVALYAQDRGFKKIDHQEGEIYGLSSVDFR